MWQRGEGSRDTHDLVWLNFTQLRRITGDSKAGYREAESDAGAGEAELASEYVRSIEWSDARDGDLIPAEVWMPSRILVRNQPYATMKKVMGDL